MSYARGLGQAKVVPGQISFQTLPEGRSGFPSLEPLVRAGLPIAPYIEHGSWTTGEPDIMRYGLDPYRGLMGLGCIDGPPGTRGAGSAGLGQVLSSLCDPTATSTAFRDRLNTAIGAGTQAALVGGAVAGALGAVLGKKSVLAAVLAGGATAWAASRIWTSTHRA